MKYFKNYIAYIKDNPEGYWFKRKLYGWGWVPAKWQGWLVLLGYIVYLTVITSSLSALSVPTDADSHRFISRVFLSAAVLIIICGMTGEPPRWQWGRKRE